MVVIVLDPLAVEAWIRVHAEVVGPGGAVEELPLRTLPRCTARAAPLVLTQVSR
jgi:hypothetical protein